ncbi:DoxX family protein [Streptomyces sp. NPDC001914]|uniref:DoxX family protein n=1 Tax=Streptomyces sp. NPDC001914 TaxID=3364623 RepID=UPI00368FDEF2
MSTALSLVLCVVFVPLGLAKLAAVAPMRAAAAHVNLTTGQYRAIGVLEIAGGAGAAAGSAFPVLGAAAATGLLLLMAGAAVTHLRAGDPVARSVPAVALALLCALDIALALAL